MWKRHFKWQLIRIKTSSDLVKYIVMCSERFLMFIRSTDIFLNNENVRRCQIFCFPPHYFSEDQPHQLEFAKEPVPSVRLALMSMKGTDHGLFCYVGVLVLLLGYTFCRQEVHVILPLSSSIVFPNQVPSDYFLKGCQAISTFYYSFLPL